MQSGLRISRAESAPKDLAIREKRQTAHHKEVDMEQIEWKRL